MDDNPDGYDEDQAIIAELDAEFRDSSLYLVREF